MINNLSFKNSKIYNETMNLIDSSRFKEAQNLLLKELNNFKNEPNFFYTLGFLFNLGFLLDFITLSILNLLNEIQLFAKSTIELELL